MLPVFILKLWADGHAAWAEALKFEPRKYDFAWDWFPMTSAKLHTIEFNLTLELVL